MTNPTPDFRALCAELLQPLAEYNDTDPYHEHGFLIASARAALATPQPEPPTDDTKKALTSALNTLEGWDNFGSWVWPVSAIEQVTKNTTESLQLLRAALAQQHVSQPYKLSEPVAPTDDELNALWNCCGDYDEEGDHYGNFFQFARAAIERWGAK